MIEQPTLSGLEEVFEDPRFLSEQLITYIGNKRSMVQKIAKIVTDLRRELGGKRLRSADLFSGSGVVSRMLKQHSDLLIANDLENYAAVISRAYLTNHTIVDFSKLNDRINYLNEIVLSGKGPRGFFSKLYAPQNDFDIKPGERVFYTQDNAKRLDAYAQLIREEEIEFQDLLLGPLLSAASVHANTGGVFKGFYKGENGIGKFGGSGADALKRIMSPITLKPIILSKFNSKVKVFQKDANILCNELDELDFVYLDPPYNQHPYGSNYFMLNLIVNYKEPEEISNVSGIPIDWNRSSFNKAKFAMASLSSLIDELNARFVLLSFSNDGFFETKELELMLQNYGVLTKFDLDYATYRAARNLTSRPLRVTEHLFLLEKG